MLGKKENQQLLEKNQVLEDGQITNGFLNKLNEIKIIIKQLLF